MRKMKWFFFGFLILIVIPIAVFSAWAWVTLRYSYSRGDRAGFVQKISQKGWVCKSWEGELAMVNLPGTAPEIFSFSVRDPKVVQGIKDSLGQRVVLVYDQHKGVPTTCFGETEYYVVEVRPVASSTDLPSTPGATPPAPLPTNPSR